MKPSLLVTWFTFTVKIATTLVAMKPAGMVMLERWLLRKPGKSTEINPWDPLSGLCMLLCFIVAALNN